MGWSTLHWFMKSILVCGNMKKTLLSKLSKLYAVFFWSVFRNRNGLSCFFQWPLKMRYITSQHNHHQISLKLRSWPSWYSDETVAVSQNVLTVTKVKIPWLYACYNCKVRRWISQLARHCDFAVVHCCINSKGLWSMRKTFLHDRMLHKFYTWT